MLCRKANDETPEHSQETPTLNVSQMFPHLCNRACIIFGRRRIWFSRQKNVLLFPSLLTHETSGAALTEYVSTAIFDRLLWPL